jgi:hypothetical protein
MSPWMSITWSTKVTGSTQVETGQRYRFVLGTIVASRPLDYQPVRHSAWLALHSRAILVSSWRPSELSASCFVRPMNALKNWSVRHEC